MSRLDDRVEALLSIRARQADDAQADELAFLTADQANLLASPETTVVGWVDDGGGKHSLEIA
jgi:hypothetical protein